MKVLIITILLMVSGLIASSDDVDLIGNWGCKNQGKIVYFSFDSFGNYKQEVKDLNLVFKGKYIYNSSTARFTIVKPVGNKTYTIIKKDESLYYFAGDDRNLCIKISNQGFVSTLF